MQVVPFFSPTDKSIPNIANIFKRVKNVYLPYQVLHHSFGVCNVGGLRCMGVHARTVVLKQRRFGHVANMGQVSKFAVWFRVK